MVASFGQMNGGRSPGGAPLCHGFGVPWLGGREFRAALTALVAAALMAAFGARCRLWPTGGRTSSWS